MKKTRFVALVLTVAVMLIGAGYAWWSDALFVDHTITTGELKVEFIKPHWAGGVMMSTYYPYLTLTPTTPDTKTVTFTAENLYPGAGYVTNAEMANTGSIPAKFDKAVVEIDEGSSKAVVDNLIFSLDFWLFDEDGNVKGVLPYQESVSLKDLETAINDVMNGVILEPGDYVAMAHGDSVDNWTYCMLSEEAGNDTANGKITFSITYTWNQFNYFP